ncbi:YkgJ family cysteine cluster protein [Telmatobacter bradus]|uniref:YkgJ family cysteine cluster protein n=1 Tax=Telmatobacter bradus TaxID=474953 RepID=UPI003B42EA4B
MLPLRDAELVQISEAALADAARRAGDALTCHPGCTECCHGAFSINALDAARLRAGLNALQESNPAQAEAVVSRAKQWVAEHSAAFPGDATTGILGGSETEQEAFEDFANDPACPALDPATGRCDVYAWRPMTCRVFGPPVRNEGDALGHCELCFQDAPTELVVASEMAVPHRLEAELLEELNDERETVVAFVLAL